MLTALVGSDVTMPGSGRSSTSASPITGPSQQQIRIVLSALVHDLRQPLSTIELCADYLTLILPETEMRARQQLGVLQEQVSDANRLISEALRLLKFEAPVAESETGQPLAAAS